ncbi:carbohydrate kinase, partial [Salmonella enterica subsp. enterica serovar Kentucky]|nr:carbohydrate kinase [Salmonella enterica subsp. enterica serovar Kentucky]
VSMVSSNAMAVILDEFPHMAGTASSLAGTFRFGIGAIVGALLYEAHPYVYGRYVNDGQYIVHEASPTSSGNLEWFTAQWGDLSF